MIRNNGGFSLIQTIISLAIAMVSGTALMSLAHNSMKFQKGMEMTTDLHDAISITKMALGASGVCGLNIGFFKNPEQGDLPRFDSAVLANQSLNVSQIQMNSTHTILSDNQPLKGNPGSIVRIKLAKIAEVTPNSNYIGELQFILDKDASRSGRVSGVRNIVRTLPVSLSTVNSGTIQTITDCSVLPMGLTVAEMTLIKKEVCQSMNGLWDSITGKCDIGPFYQP